MIRAIVELDFHVHHGIAGDDTVLHGLHDAFLHCGDEVPGNGAAEDGILELVAFTTRQWLNLDPAIAELATATGLFLVAALGLGFAPNGLTIGHLRRM